MAHYKIFLMRYKEAGLMAQVVGNIINRF